jgi:thiol-disulfide isomerase/thioredoxin
MLGPTMKKVEAEGITIDKVNIDEETSQNLVAEYAIRSVPTVILVDDTGKEFARTVGAKPMNHYIEQYNNFTNV